MDSIIRIDVTGNMPANGKTMITAMIAEFLAKALPSVNVQVELHDTRDSFVRRMTVMPSEAEEMIRAETIHVVDNLSIMPPIPDAATNVIGVSVVDRNGPCPTIDVISPITIRPGFIKQ